MARFTSSEGLLQVGKCHCETGRQRHNIPSSVQILYESSTLSSPHDPDPDSEDDNANANVIGVGNTQLSVIAFLQSGPALTGNEVDIILNGYNVDPNEGNGNGDNDDDDDDDGDDANENDANENGANEGDHVEDDDTDDQDWASEELEIDLNELWPGTEEEEPEEDFDLQIPPRVATWRLNLTALSQVYNLYMVAYGDRIYVSRPRSCVTNALPPEPDLILRPKPSSTAAEIGGYLDPSDGHQVNHLIVGELGNEEILLLAYDNGDVIGYYTHLIEKELLQREKTGRAAKSIPEPFFHENVERSAWGLAIHKQSRVIAVSSNTHNVYVFIFALTGHPYVHKPNVDPHEFFRTIIKDENGNLVDQEGSVKGPASVSKTIGVEKAIQCREANWRIVLWTGRTGTNIPNIALSSDADGNVDKVLAVDINGTLWLMDFWHFNARPPVTINGLHSQRRRERQNLFDRPSSSHMGWGVLVLPESSFLPTKDYTSALGLPVAEAKYAANKQIGHWIDISQGIKYVKNTSTTHPWVRSNNSHHFVINPLEHRRLPEGSWFDFEANVTLPSLLDIGNKFPLFNESARAQSSSSDGNKTILPDGSSIMRTYEMDIELRSFEEDGTGIMFEKVIEQSRPPRAVIPAMRRSHERLANLIHVPELSLVVAGSLCGRVALVTLTKPKEKVSFKRSFKVEAILPTKKEEDAHLRPICPLLGVAIAPAPLSGNIKLADGAIGPRRYRLMLHYYDLRILSYDVFRNSPTEPLRVA
ncbi:hypothetical protein M426DRAFT_24997 [Hypoxylon sp. CI-4A]|nr:hypothetical protein M426DRAFT_24997 [Hypoxylon sp. CI-4A]